MRDRVSGIENEYGVMIVEKIDGKDYCRPIRTPSDHLVIPPGNFSKFGLLSLNPGTHQGFAWLYNGGYIYVEGIAHPEYASPECRRVLDAVRFNKAGEQLICRAFPNHKFFKDNCAPPATSSADAPMVDGLISYGCHESYLVFNIPDFNASHFVSALAPFLASRQIIDGSGFVDSRGELHLSQRAPFIDLLTSSGTLNSRAIVNLKKENHTGSRADLCRLHLIVGDANLMETALFLKIGTTSLVLSMMEDGCAPSFSITVDWPRFLREMNDNVFGKAKVILLPTGDRFSALELQWIYCDAAIRYVSKTSFESEESEHEAKMICRLWERAIDALWSNDMNWLVGRLDHATLRYIFSAEERKEGHPLSVEKKKKISQNYRKVNKGENMSKRLSDRLSHTRLLTDAQIADALVNPPKDTRAALRSSFLRKVAKARKKLPGVIGSVGWHTLLLNGKNADLNDPLCFTPPGRACEEMFDKLDKISSGELTNLPTITYHGGGY